MFLTALTIVELFASHVPQRMQIMSAGDGRDGHFQAIFPMFSTMFLHRVGARSVDRGPQTISEALVAAFRIEDLQRAAL